MGSGYWPTFHFLRVNPKPPHTLFILYPPPPKIHVSDPFFLFLLYSLAAAPGLLATSRLATRAPTLDPSRRSRPTCRFPRMGYVIATYYLLPATCYLLPTTCYLLPTTYYMLPTTCYVLPTTCYLLPATCYLLPIEILLYAICGPYSTYHVWVNPTPYGQHIPNSKMSIGLMSAI